MIKVAINRCFGGFGLSDAAFEKLLERKGITFDKIVSEETSLLHGTTYYAAGHAGDDDHYLAKYQFFEDRSDSDLIAVIEELNTHAAQDYAADITIVEIPDGVEWHIDDYDGIEHVAENHRTWYGD